MDYATSRKKGWWARMNPMVKALLIGWLATIAVGAAVALGMTDHLNPEAVTAIVVGTTATPLGYLVGYTNGGSAVRNGNGSKP